MFKKFYAFCDCHNTCISINELKNLVFISLDEGSNNCNYVHIVYRIKNNVENRLVYDRNNLMISKDYHFLKSFLGKKVKGE